MKRVLCLSLLLITLVSCGHKVEPNSPDDSTSAVMIEIAEDENEIPSEVGEEYLANLKARYTQPTLVIGDIAAQQGDTVIVRAVIVNNEGILGMSGALSYDESVMTLVQAENGAVFNETLNFTASEDLKSGCRFVWDGLDLEPEQVKDGVMLNLTFKIQDNALTGRYPVTFVLDNKGTVDSQLNVLELEVDCGYITIS